MNNDRMENLKGSEINKGEGVVMYKENSKCHENFRCHDILFV
jgi:hypothetical protein